MSLNQRLTTEFSPCTPSAPQSRDLSIQTFRPCGFPFLSVSDFAMFCTHRDPPI